MKRLILFIAAALVSVATVQAQSRDVVEIAKGLLPKGFLVQQDDAAETTHDESAAVVEEAAEETVKEAVAVIEEVAQEAPETPEVSESPETPKRDVYAIVKAILPPGFSLEQSATKETPLSGQTPMQEIASYVDEYVDAIAEESAVEITTIVKETAEVVEESATTVVEDVTEVAEDSVAVIEEVTEVAEETAEVAEETAEIAEETAEVIEESVAVIEEVALETPETPETPEIPETLETPETPETPETAKQDIYEIVKIILPSDFFLEQSATDETPSSDLTPVVEVAADDKVEVEEVAVIEDLAQDASDNIETTETTETTETAEVAEATTEAAEVAEVVDVAEIVEAILPADFCIEQYAANSSLTTVLTPKQQISAYVDSSSAVKTRFLPMRQRVDRNIGVNKFVYKGEFMLGLTASYGNISTDNSDLMLLVNDIDVSLRSTTVRPFLAYAYRDNMAVGIRFGYQYINGGLGNVDVNLGLLADGLEGMNISDLGLRNESFSWALFHRNYLGLDRRGIVGVIIESEMLVKTGTSRFMSGGDAVDSSLSRNFAAQLNVNPGLAIYIFPQVCVTATVGIGGLRYNNVRQYDAAGEVIGRRDHSSLNFKINITDIQIGLVAHLWNNKKK